MFGQIYYGYGCGPEKGVVTGTAAARVTSPDLYTTRLSFAFYKASKVENSSPTAKKGPSPRCVIANDGGFREEQKQT